MKSPIDWGFAISFTIIAFLLVWGPIIIIYLL